MSVSSNSPLSSANVNAAFVSRTQDTNTTGVVSLENTTDPDSGASVENIQQAANEIFDAVGMTGIDDTNRKNYSSNNVISNGDDRKVALGKVDAKFHATTGHAHTGAAGDGPQISAANLTNFNQYFTEFQSFTKASASGTSVDITSAMSGKVVYSTTGVPTSSPNNKVHIVNSSTNTWIEDAEGQRVYGRITESAGTWTLSFYTNEAGVETAHSLSSQTIIVIHLEVFTAETRPIFPSNPLEFGTLDVTADVVDAGLAQRGVVSTGTQTFGGAKTFNSSLIFLGLINGSFVTDSATTGSNATLPAPTKLVTRITNASLTSISDITAPSGTNFFILLNKTGTTVTIVNTDAAATDIITGAADINLASNASVWLLYDTTTSRWYVVGGSGSGASGGLPDIQGTRQTGVSMSAGTAITAVAGNHLTAFVVGSGGPVTITAAPRIIVSGMTRGQRVKIVGTSDTNTVKYTSDANLVLSKGDAVLGKDQEIEFEYMGSDGTNAAFVEIGRNF